MNEDATVKKPAPAKKEAPVEDTRVDEYALSIFVALGYDKNKLPDKLVEVYKDIKLRKDRLTAGKFSPFEFAYISYIADLFKE